MPLEPPSGTIPLYWATQDCPQALATMEQFSSASSAQQGTQYRNSLDFSLTCCAVLLAAARAKSTFAGKTKNHTFIVGPFAITE